MTDVIPFEDALKPSSDGRTILLGNGFSIAQAGGQFSYSSLLEKSGLTEKNPIRAVFTRLRTFDFEVVMKALEDASQIELAYSDEAKAKRFAEDSAAVREALIHAIYEVHPGVQFEVPETQIETCGKFLMHFDRILYAELRSTALLGYLEGDERVLRWLRPWRNAKRLSNIRSGSQLQHVLFARRVATVL